MKVGGRKIRWGHVCWKAALATRIAAGELLKIACPQLVSDVLNLQNT